MAHTYPRIKLLAVPIWAPNRKNNQRRRAHRLQLLHSFMQDLTLRTVSVSAVKAAALSHSATGVDNQYLSNHLKSNHSEVTYADICWHMLTSWKTWRFHSIHELFSLSSLHAVSISSWPVRKTKMSPDGSVRWILRCDSKLWTRFPCGWHVEKLQHLTEPCQTYSVDTVDSTFFVVFHDCTRANLTLCVCVLLRLAFLWTMLNAPKDPESPDCKTVIRAAST